MKIDVKYIMTIVRIVSRPKTYSLVIKLWLAIVCVTSGISTMVYGDEPEHLRQSIRALGMGNSFVAVANDESALFYNPAGLQSLQYVIFELVALDITANQKLIDLTLLEASEVTAEIGEVVGKNIFLETNVVLASITAPGWGYSIFGGGHVSSIINNPIIPNFEFKIFAQYGLIGGIAWQFMDQVLDIGISLKSVTREGISKTVHIVDLLDEDFADELSDEYKTFNKVSPDLGVLYHFDYFANMELRLAYVIRNMGGMDFGSIGMIPMTMDVGMAADSEFDGIDLIWSVDYVDITNEATKYRSPQRNLKIGVESGVFKRSNGQHALSARIGLNGVYLTYGFSINFPYFPMKIDYAKWSEEIGNVAGEIEDKRQSIQVSINF